MVKEINYCFAQQRTTYRIGIHAVVVPFESQRKKMGSVTNQCNVIIQNNTADSLLA